MEMKQNLVSHGRCSSLHSAGGELVDLTRLDVLAGVPRPMRRKMGRLAKLMYVAVAEASASVELPKEFPLVVGTAYGEIDMGLDVLADLHESGGTLLRPVKVQNSVHIALAGYLGILLSNRGPTLTVSHGKLTAEASLDALLTLMRAYSSPMGIVVMGDLFNPDWSTRLQDRSPAHHALLTQSPFHEGAVALVLADEEIAPNASWQLSGGVYRLPDRSDDLVNKLDKLFRHLPPGTEIFGREMAPWSDTLLSPDRITRDYGHRYIHQMAGLGTSMTGPLDHLLSLISSYNNKAMVFLGRDGEEIGYIQCE